VKEITAEMPTKRGSLEIYAAILAVAKNGAKKSHIVYKANLNFEQGQRYLDQLTSYGLIQGPTSREHAFHTTTKGLEFIKRFEGLKAFQSESPTPLRSEEIPI
jgi:predicted transcriptional regulator